MNENIFLILVLVAAFGVAMLNIRALDKRNQERLEALRSSATPPEQSTQKPRWYGMLCGTRLELGATGYWIELVGKKGHQSFRAYDPEGDCIETGQNLTEIKKALEKQASYRTEFKPSKPSNYLHLNDER